MEAGATIGLSMALAVRRRWIQKPSKPASWMTTSLAEAPVRSSVLALSRASRSRSAPPLPPVTDCFDIVSLPGDREVTSQRDRLNSRETKIALGSVRGPVLFWREWVVVDIGRLLEGVRATSACQSQPPATLIGSVCGRRLVWGGDRLFCPTLGRSR